MKEYRLDFSIFAKDGLTETDLWYRLMWATKHSGLDWHLERVIEVLDYEPEE